MSRQPLSPNPYDFITSPGQQPKKSFLSGGSLKTRLLLIVGGAVVLMILLALVTVILTSGNQGNTTALKNLVAQQQELARVADLGIRDAKDSSTRALALTTKLSIVSQQHALTAYLKECGAEPKREELEKKKNAATDTSLESAAATNRYDDAFREELETQIKAYTAALAEAYEDIANETGKSLLASSYDSASLLLDPAKS